MKKILAVSILALTLGACSQTMSADPVGIGRGVNDLKSSPCACTEIPMDTSRFESMAS